MCIGQHNLSVLRYIYSFLGLIKKTAHALSKHAYIDLMHVYHPFQEQTTELFGFKSENVGALNIFY
jgi:hypothetical protein